MEKTNDIRHAVMTAEDLDELLAALQAAEEQAEADRQDDSAADAGDGIEQRYGIDITDLPLFGAEPDNTLGAYSWDASRILTAYGSQWALVDRTEWEESAQETAATGVAESAAVYGLTKKVRTASEAKRGDYVLWERKSRQYGPHGQLTGVAVDYTLMRVVRATRDDGFATHICRPDEYRRATPTGGYERAGRTFGLRELATDPRVERLADREWDSPQSAAADLRALLSGLRGVAEEAAEYEASPACKSRINLLIEKGDKERTIGEDIELGEYIAATEVVRQVISVPSPIGDGEGIYLNISKKVAADYFSYVQTQCEYAGIMDKRVGDIAQWNLYTADSNTIYLNVEG